MTKSNSIEPSDRELRLALFKYFRVYAETASNLDLARGENPPWDPFIKQVRKDYPWWRRLAIINLTQRITQAASFVSDQFRYVLGNHSYESFVERLITPAVSQLLTPPDLRAGWLRWLRDCEMALECGAPFPKPAPLAPVCADRTLRTLLSEIQDYQLPVPRGSSVQEEIHSLLRLVSNALPLADVDAEVKVPRSPTREVNLAVSEWLGQMGYDAAMVGNDFSITLKDSK